MPSKHLTGDQKVIGYLKEDLAEEKDKRLRLEKWLDKQFPGWRDQYDKYRLAKIITGREMIK